MNYEGPKAEAARRIVETYVPKHICEKLAEGGITIRTLAKGERYAAASGELSRLAIDVDLWPVAPAGLFVVTERTLYLRCVDAMTVVHELGHAFDCVLGGGAYRSGIDPDIRGAFENAEAFVTPYASTAIDEYFAESFRAMCEANIVTSTWPKVSRARLERCDASMYSIMQSLMEAPE